MFNGLAKTPIRAQKEIAIALVPIAGLGALVGLVLLGLGIAGGETSEECSGRLWWKECKDVYNDWSRGTDLFLMTVGAVAILLAITCIVVSTVIGTMQGRLKKYLPILTGVETMSVRKIADITNLKPSRVRSDIQTLIDSGSISDYYIDYDVDQVVSKRYTPKWSYKTVVRCYGCGAPNDVIVGITKNCSHCGQPLMLGTT